MVKVAASKGLYLWGIRAGVGVPFLALVESSRKWHTFELIDIGIHYRFQSDDQWVSVSMRFNSVHKARVEPGMSSMNNGLSVPRSSGSGCS